MPARASRGGADNAKVEHLVAERPVRAAVRRGVDPAYGADEIAAGRTRLPRPASTTNETAARLSVQGSGMVARKTPFSPQYLRA